MKFLNRHVLTHAFIVLITTVALYYALAHLHTGLAIAVCMSAYIITIILSTFLNHRKDQYQGYFGFNYHFMTYVVCCAIPALGIAAGMMDKETIGSLLFMAGCWGAGVLVHLLLMLFCFRKRRIRDYDSKEIFS